MPVQMQSMDQVKAHHIPSDIAVDDFNHSAWMLCEPVRIAQYWSGEPAPVHRQAEARLLWSKSALYARFIGPQQEPLVINPLPRTDVKTLGLWDRDVCEIFIAPDLSDPNSYFEFEGAPTGEWVDLAIRKNAEGRETDFAFDSGITAAAHVAPDQIVVSLRIPWSERIPQPQLNDKWRVNLFRCVGSDPNRGYVTWRPTHTPEPSFHSPEAFGWVLFSE